MTVMNAVGCKIDQIGSSCRRGVVIIAVIGIGVPDGIRLGQIYDILVDPLQLDEGDNRADGQRKQKPAQQHFFYIKRRWKSLCIIIHA